MGAEHPEVTPRPRRWRRHDAQRQLVVRERVVAPEVERAHFAVTWIAREILGSRRSTRREERERDAERAEKPPHHRRPWSLAVTEDRPERCSVSRGDSPPRATVPSGVRSMKSFTT